MKEIDMHRQLRNRRGASEPAFPGAPGCAGSAFPKVDARSVATEEGPPLRAVTRSRPPSPFPCFLLPSSFKQPGGPRARPPAGAPGSIGPPTIHCALDPGKARLGPALNPRG